MKNVLALAALAVAFALPGCKAEVLCAAGQTLCDGHCVSTDVDGANCGGCGVRCGSHEECDARACGGAPGAMLCGGSWVDLVTDPAHCGACGQGCAAGAFCRADGLGTGCDGSCPGGTSACGHACVTLASDRFNCGACGVECRRGESCRAGACAPDLYVACFATDDVRPMSASLRAGIPQPAGDGPIALAVLDGRVHVASSLSHSVTSFDAALRTPGYEHFLGGGDLEEVTAHDGRLYISNADAGTLVVMRGDTGAFVDEVVLASRGGANPRSVAFVGDTAYVALAGRDPESAGQEIAVVDFSGPRGVVTSRISVAALAAPGALAFPSGVAAIGTKVYATTGNLMLGMFGYTDPAGPSQLAVIDASVDPATLGTVDLGDACTNAGAIVADGTRLWISCSGTGNVLPVDVSGGSPVVGTPVPTGLWGAWKIAICHGMGYVTDAWMGQVFRFDPTGAASPASSGVCPLVGEDPYKWAFAAGVACAP